MRCILCGQRDSVRSGLNTFIFGVPTEVVCYECASKDGWFKEALARRSAFDDEQSTTSPR